MARSGLTLTDRAMVVLAGFTAVLLFVPLAGLLARAPWGEVAVQLAAPATVEALRLSLLTSVLAVALAVFLGLPLAWVLARLEFPGRPLLRALALLPMVLPPVVGGVALLLAFGRRGFLGSWLESAFGIHLAFTTGGAVLAEAFVGIPFFVVTAEAGLRSADRRLEEAARTLGAGSWRVARTITLPLVAPSLGAGALLAWARALGEFGATITFAGNVPGSTQTLPLAIYVALDQAPEAAITMSLALMAVSVVILGLLRDRWLRPGG